MNLSQQQLGDIVANDFRTASILSNAGLDFCCGGKKTLDQACREKGISTDKIAEKIESIHAEPETPGQNYREWAPAFLCDYIVNTHHTYIYRTLPNLVFFTEKIANVHGQRHLELIEIASIVKKLNDELLSHLRNEEEILFPAIKSISTAFSKEAAATIKSEISRMNGEHEFAGESMDRINGMTRGYKVPDDGCDTYRVSFRLLEQFEKDLHIHVHLENNILFKKALAIAGE
ncbi:MAG: iron-sulfur cluster repair di-iron protein [Bacteroidales bacterium]